jgi:CDP-paratose 2-epimerase
MKSQHHHDNRDPGRPAARRDGDAPPGSNGQANRPSRNDHTAAPHPGRDSHRRRVLITGGAGFIGTNLAARLIESGQPVRIYDNLSRPGVEHNLRWLRNRYGNDALAQISDIRDPEPVRQAVEEASAIFHLAAQVAVTTSLRDPAADFAANAIGTINLLEACRNRPSPPPVVFTSTNKVYGGLHELELRREGDRYTPTDERIRDHGIDEQQHLRFRSPYGCSKGVADQYVTEYARSYRLPTLVFRMSCIYGPHQCGTEDQGWVAHFSRRVLRDQPITLYGDGRQVRDLLYVDDLVEAMLAAWAHIQSLSGSTFNLGGGPDNALSLLEVVQTLGQLRGRTPPIEHDDWRPGDQKYYVSDTRAFRRATDWQPRVGVSEGIPRLYRWLANQGTASSEPAAV